MRKISNSLLMVLLAFTLIISACSEEEEFASSDTTAPTNANIIIKGGDISTFSDKVTLSLAATDAVGVTGYYVSETSTTPVTSASGWVSVSSATTYSDNVSFALSSGYASKTVYAWFKDAVGNVSTSVSDNITMYEAVASVSGLTLVISRTGTDSNNVSYTSNNLEWQLATAVENDGLSSGLTWESGTKLNWNDAISYCAQLGLANKSGWRLPTKTELASLIDMGQTPKIVSSLTASTNSDTYWSFTNYELNTSGAWSLSFFHGGIFVSEKHNSYYYLRCVRGGE